MTDHADHFLGKDPQHPRPTWEELFEAFICLESRFLGAVQVEIWKKKVCPMLSKCIRVQCMIQSACMILHEQTVRCCESKEKL